MLQLINYSGRAIALFGETKPHAATLVNMNGRFNPNLTRDGKKAAPIEQTIPVITTRLAPAETAYKYRELNGPGKLNLARLYIAEIHSMQDVRCVNSAIANVIGYVTRASFERFGDKNNITMSIAKTYFRKNGAGLDQVAMLASEALGMEITPDNVVDYILKFPFGWPTCRTEKMKLINEAYKEVHGKEMNRAVAKLIVDTYNEMKAEINRNEVNNDIF